MNLEAADLRKRLDHVSELVEALIADDYLHHCGELLTEISDYLHASREPAEPFVSSGRITLIEIPGVPVPKGRPRMGAGRVFTPAKTTAAETRIGWAARQAGVFKATGDVGVSIGFYFTNRKHGDIDNLAKTVLDGLNGVAYADDRQVKRLALAVVTGASEAKTVIEVDG